MKHATSPHAPLGVGDTEQVSDIVKVKIEAYLKKIIPIQQITYTDTWIMNHKLTVLINENSHHFTTIHRAKH